MVGEAMGQVFMESKRIVREAMGQVLMESKRMQKVGSLQTMASFRRGCSSSLFHRRSTRDLPWANMIQEFSKADQRSFSPMVQ